MHGDLGMLTPDDVLIAISNSGETEEILKIIPAIKKRKIPLIAMCGKKNSTLVKQGDIFKYICKRRSMSLATCSDVFDNRYFSNG